MKMKVLTIYWLNVLLLRIFGTMLSEFLCFDIVGVKIRRHRCIQLACWIVMLTRGLGDMLLLRLKTKRCATEVRGALVCHLA
jgi:hypothetical protein